MKTAKFYYLSALTGALILGGPALADSKSDEAAFVAAERANMLAVDRWATNTRSELTRVGSTDADRLRSIQGDVQEFLNDIQKVCRDNPQAQKLEAYIHSKFHGFYDISDITHGVNMSCSPDHKLRPNALDHQNNAEESTRGTEDSQYQERSVQERYNQKRPSQE